MSTKTSTKSHQQIVAEWKKVPEFVAAYLLNFGDDLMKDGITRVLNGKLE